MTYLCIECRSGWSFREEASLIPVYICVYLYIICEGFKKLNLQHHLSCMKYVWIYFRCLMLILSRISDVLLLCCLLCFLQCAVYKIKNEEFIFKKIHLFSVFLFDMIALGRSWIVMYTVKYNDIYIFLVIIGVIFWWQYKYTIS